MLTQVEQFDSRTDIRWCPVRHRLQVDQSAHVRQGRAALRMPNGKSYTYYLCYLLP